MVIKKYIIIPAIILIIILGFLPGQSLGAPDAYPCPCSIWSPSDTPAVTQDETLPVEIGVVFSTEADGYITGLRFYKSIGNTGTHYGHLWTTSGTLLATVIFTGESDTGWQEATFPMPIAIFSDTTYIASYHTETGYWSLTSGGLTSAVYNEPLTALASSSSPLGNGVYKYGPSGSFPNESVNGSNYWVDVVFNTSVPPDSIAPTVSVVTPTDLAIDVDRNTNVTARFNEAVTPSSINSTTFTLLDPSQNPIAADVTYVRNIFTATLNPTSSLSDSTTYTAIIKGGDTGVEDLAGNHLAADYIWTFTTTAPDLIPPTVSGITPFNQAAGVYKNVTLEALFSEAIDPATINSDTFELRDPSNVKLGASVTYNNSTHTAMLDPTTVLTDGTTYTARIIGGDPGVADLAGNHLAGDYTWSFTTATSPDQGPGGSILVIFNSGNPFGRYYAEILRAEGLNEFAVMDISDVDSETLASYDVVILGEMSLTSDQVSMFTSWVTAGGNLIAMRPDKQLASLLGLDDDVGTLPTTQLYAYLLVDTSDAPGQGIVNQTIQYHGIADLYTLNEGTTEVAELYSDAATATNKPAVTVRSVGSNGGQAAAFTYDLARSVVYTRQGNPEWAAQDRDPNDPSGSRIILTTYISGMPAMIPNQIMSISTR